MNKSIIIRYFIFAISLNWIFNGYSQDCFPQKKDFQFVYDVANILDETEEQELNNELLLFTKNTSNVLIIVTTPDLCEYDRAEYTYTLADKWGVGRADLDNGVVLMVKPKEADGKGETFIAVGNGLQGVIPDLVASRDIINRELIPNFKKQDYYKGIYQASQVIMALASKEYSYQDYQENNNSIIPIIIILIIVIVLVIFIKKGGGNDWESFDRNGKRYHRTTPWIIFPGGGGSRGGGGFSGGGFGGFGGGGFDGGGAGGSW